MLWRSSLRDFGDGRPVEFRVYDQRQATFLRDFISENAPHVTVTLEQVDLGLDGFKRRKRGREKFNLADAERIAKMERRRVQACERQRRHRAKLASAAMPSLPICASTVPMPLAGPPA
jgi:hypothetical protein